jgi:hypothetical protein
MHKTTRDELADRIVFGFVKMGVFVLFVVGYFN